jgi:hypothetical protein
VGLVLLVAACADESPGPEAQVRAVIAAMQTSVESGSIRQASELLDAQYRDRRHANKRMAVRSLLGLTQRHRGIHLFALIESVTIAPEQNAADAIVYVAMTGVPVESMEALISLKADLYRFDVRLNEIDGAWRIVGSDWRRVEPGAP